MAPCSVDCLYRTARWRVGSVAEVRAQWQRAFHPEVRSLHHSLPQCHLFAHAVHPVDVGTHVCSCEESIVSLIITWTLKLFFSGLYISRFYGLIKPNETNAHLYHQFMTDIVFNNALAMFKITTSITQWLGW